MHIQSEENKCIKKVPEQWFLVPVVTLSVRYSTRALELQPKEALTRGLLATLGWQENCTRTKLALCYGGAPLLLVEFLRHQQFPLPLKGSVQTAKRTLWHSAWLESPLLRRAQIAETLEKATLMGVRALHKCRYWRRQIFDWSSASFLITLKTKNEEISNWDELGPKQPLSVCSEAQVRP